MTAKSKVRFTRLLQSNFPRFLVSGAFNTGITYVVYLLLVLVIPYQASYTISYVLGIFLAFLLNRFFVFKQHRGLQSVMFFPLVYLWQYLCGMLILWVWVEKLGLGEKTAPLIAVIITIPITYFLSRFIFVKK